MNEQEAIARTQAWYLERYHMEAQGHITLDAEEQELRVAQFLCVDLVPLRGAAVVNVVVDLTGAEPVALLDEDVRRPRCALRAASVTPGRQESEAQPCVRSAWRS